MKLINPTKAVIFDIVTKAIETMNHAFSIEVNDNTIEYEHIVSLRNLLTIAIASNAEIELNDTESLLIYELSQLTK